MKYNLIVNDAVILEIANAVEQINAIPVDGTAARVQLNITLPSNSTETLMSINDLFNSITVSKLEVLRIDNDGSQYSMFLSTSYKQPNVVRSRFTAESPYIEIIFFRNN